MLIEISGKLVSVFYRGEDPKTDQELDVRYIQKGQPSHCGTLLGNMNRTYYSALYSRVFTV